MEFDPLAALIEAAHSRVHRGLRFTRGSSPCRFGTLGHAANPRPITCSRCIPFGLPSPTLGQAEDGHSYYLDPGHPGVQEHLSRVVTDLLRRYDVDGLQLDYIRYSGNQWGYNPVALNRFKRLTGRD